MASYRFLSFTRKKRKLAYRLALIFITASMILYGCGTARKSANNNKSTGKTNALASSNTGSKAFARLLAANRSQLSDVYASQKNSVPEALKQKANGPNIGNPKNGYRIQILSTRDMSRADSVAKKFRFWADKAMSQYVPQAYVLFRQPYYKVRVGNFEVYKQASRLNRLLKKKYPGAWVVHDNIKPNLVPADSTKFKLKRGY